MLEQIDYQYIMTEESESEETVRRHELSWRSEGNFNTCLTISRTDIITNHHQPALTKLLKKLDKRGERSSLRDLEYQLRHPQTAPRPRMLPNRHANPKDVETLKSIDRVTTDEARPTTSTATPSGAVPGGNAASSRRRIILRPDLYLLSISEELELDRTEFT